MDKLLVIDVGNTEVKYAFFNKDVLEQVYQHPVADTAKRCPEILSASNIPIALSCVVPETGKLIKASAGSRKLVEISASSQKFLTGMDNTMGGDRVASAVGAWKFYGKGEKPVIIMAFGTATTLLAISKTGHVTGGWIAPGLSITLEVLHDRCALLPLLNMKGQSQSLGSDTQTHMLNGVFVAHLGLCRQWLEVAAKDLESTPVTVATGGWAQTIQEETKLFHYLDKDITVKGIYLIASQITSS